MCILVCMLMKGISIVNFASVHSVIRVRLQRILAYTVGKENFLAMYVSTHSLGNVILLVIFENFMRLESVRCGALHVQSLWEILCSVRDIQEA